jgi:hypothetical protein
LFEELTFPRALVMWGQSTQRWHTRLQFAVAAGALLGIALVCGIVLSKTVFLGSDAAHHYAHVWYVSDQLFHHWRLPLHVRYLESGHALTFPYGLVLYLATALPYALLGDRAVTAAMVVGFVFYGYAATRARRALRDPRLLTLVYINTFLIEGLVSFQFAFIWAVGFFFMCVEAVDRRRWAAAAVWAVLAVTTHPFAGGAAVVGYTLFAAVRRPRDAVPLFTAMAIAAAIVLPYALYARTTPSVGTTRESYLLGTLRYMARFRGAVVLLPLVVSMLARVLRPLFLPAFAVMALTFAYRIEHKHVNTFGFDNNSHPFYGEFIRSPQFDRALTYRVLEPNDREDGAYQLIKHGAVLAQEFFDQSQFRGWWNSPEQYSCFLGAKDVDVVLLEKDYPLKWKQNEDRMLSEFEQQGRARVIYRDPGGRFSAYDVRGARRDGAQFAECGL